MSAESSENPLKKFLAENLTDVDNVEENQVVTDVMVIYRVACLDDEDGFAERYEYVTSPGLSYALARGLLSVTEENLINYYQNLLNGFEEEDDD